MAQLADAVQDAPARAYLSPKRILARAFEKSRDRWKEKYQSVRKQLLARVTDVRDLRRSRDRWRAKAENLQQQLKQLRGELDNRTESSPPARS